MTEKPPIPSDDVLQAITLTRTMLDEAVGPSWDRATELENKAYKEGFEAGFKAAGQLDNAG